MKRFEVNMTMLVAVSVEVEADNEEQAEKLAMEKTAREEAYYLQHYDSIWEREVTGVSECEDDDNDDFKYPDPADSVDDDDPAQEVYAAYSKDMRKAVAYINRQMEQWELDIIRAKVDRNFKQHMNPANGIDDHRIIDLLEEYGEDNDLPEGWWEEYGDIDDILMKL